MSKTTPVSRGQDTSNGIRDIVQCMETYSMQRHRSSPKSDRNWCWHTGGEGMSSKCASVVLLDLSGKWNQFSSSLVQDYQIICRDVRFQRSGGFCLASIPNKRIRTNDWGWAHGYYQQGHKLCNIGYWRSSQGCLRFAHKLLTPLDLSKKNPFYSVMEESPLGVAIDILGSVQGIHRINVMHPDGSVTGILSQTDIIRFIASKKDLFKGTLEQSVPPLLFIYIDWKLGYVQEDSCYNPCWCSCQWCIAKDGIPQFDSLANHWWRGQVDWEHFNDRHSFRFPESWL